MNLDYSKPHTLLAGLFAAVGGAFSAIISYLDIHATGIGILISMLSLILMTVFKVIEIRRSKPKERRYNDKQLNEIEQSIKKIESRINSKTE